MSDFESGAFNRALPTLRRKPLWPKDPPRSDGSCLRLRPALLGRSISGSPRASRDLQEPMIKGSGNSRLAEDRADLPRWWVLRSLYRKCTGKSDVRAIATSRPLYSWHLFRVTRFRSLSRRFRSCRLGRGASLARSRLSEIQGLIPVGSEAQLLS